MKTVIKAIGLIIAIVILLFVVCVIVFTKAVNPNDFKTSIDQFVYQKTGRYLAIYGDVRWSFFPWLGIDLQQVQLTNPSGISGPNLATVGDIQVKVRFWPLLKGQIEFGRVIINHAVINLIKTNNGQTNWQDWQKPAPVTTPGPNAAAPSTPSIIKPTVKIKPKWSTFNIEGIDVTSSTINLINQKNNEIISLKHFNLSTTPIATADYFALTTQFVLQTSQSSNVEVPVRLTAAGNLNPEDLVFKLNNLNLNGTIERPQMPSLSFSLSGNVTADIKQQTFSFDPLLAQIVNLKLTGKLQIAQILQTPTIQISLATQSTDIEPLMTALHGKPFLKGQLTFNANLTSTGDTQATLTQNLNGQGSISLLDGTIYGFNIKQTISKGQGLLSKNPLMSTEPEIKQTDFSHLTASFNIQDGIVRNDDFSLLGGEIAATGHGSIDLNQKTMMYTFTMQYAPANIAGQPPFVIPIIVSGSLNSPNIKPDFSGVIKRIVTNALEKKIEKLTGKKLDLNKP